MEEKMKQIMADMAAGKLTQEEAAKQCAALMKPAEPPKKPLQLGISPTTGVVCLYGLQSRPVSLYANQWKRIVENIDTIKTFLEENKDKLKWER